LHSPALNCTLSVISLNTQHHSQPVCHLLYDISQRQTEYDDDNCDKDRKDFRLFRTFIKFHSGAQKCHRYCKFSDTRVSQDSIATSFRHGEIFTPNFPDSEPLGELLKSDNILLSYTNKKAQLTQRERATRDSSACMKAHCEQMENP